MKKNQIIIGVVTLVLLSIIGTYFATTAVINSKNSDFNKLESINLRSSSVMSNSSTSKIESSLLIDQKTSNSTSQKTETSKTVENKSQQIKFKNLSKLTKIEGDELSCFGIETVGEIAYRYGSQGSGNSSIAVINTIENIKNPVRINIADGQKLDYSNDTNQVDAFLNYLKNGELTPSSNENRMQGTKYRNPGYGFFGCHNYASGISREISINLPGFDYSKAYMSYGSQGGLPGSAIEIYGQKGNQIMQIMSGTNIPDKFGKDCGVEFGGNDQDLKCYFDKVDSILTDSKLKSLAQDLVDIYAIEK
jgi:hypothetical protein